MRPWDPYGAEAIWCAEQIVRYKKKVGETATRKCEGLLQKVLRSGAPRVIHRQPAWRMKRSLADSASLAELSYVRPG